MKIDETQQKVNRKSMNIYEHLYKINETVLKLIISGSAPPAALDPTDYENLQAP